MNQEIPSEQILKNAVELRAKDWCDWAGNRHSKESWDLMNPIDLKETDYLLLGLLKYLDDTHSRTNKNKGDCGDIIR